MECVNEFRYLAALGSSFAAGPMIEPIVDQAVMRSARNYPHLLAERLGAPLADVTVSGATTATILEDQALGAAADLRRLQDRGEQLDTLDLAGIYANVRGRNLTF